MEYTSEIKFSGYLNFLIYYVISIIIVLFVRAGFWPNDPHRFGVLSYHSSNHIAERPQSYGEDEHKEALHAQALIASFAFTYGTACYQGEEYFLISAPLIISRSELFFNQFFHFFILLQDSPRTTISPTHSCRNLFSPTDIDSPSTSTS